MYEEATKRADLLDNELSLQSGHVRREVQKREKIINEHLMEMEEIKNGGKSVTK